VSCDHHVDARRRVGPLVLLFVLWTPLSVLAQAPEQKIAEPIRNDSDPTRAVLFSIRPEFSWLNADVARSALIFRYDYAALRQRRWLPGRRGVILRLEMPIAQTSTASTDAAGLGDAYAQLLTIPYFTRKFAFAVGTGLGIPTATDDLLGTGHLVVAPAIAPVWFLEGGMFFVRVQNSTTVAGDDSRPDFNVFIVAPTFIRNVGARFWVLADTETQTDWRRDERTGIKSGLQVGRAIAGRIGVWAKPEVWWGPNPAGRWNLKLGIFWYRP
jgi:hypothetical protein